MAHPIDCSCGNKGCSTKLTINNGTGYVNIFVSHYEKDKLVSQEVALDPNQIVQLIKQLKQALMDIS